MFRRKKKAPTAEDDMYGAWKFILILVGVVIVLGLGTGAGIVWVLYQLGSAMLK